jgi:hypothetical protein
MKYISTKQSIITAFVVALNCVGTAGFTPVQTTTKRTKLSHDPLSKVVLSSSTDDNNEKFSFAQRIESTKTGLVGLFAGGIALTPVAAFHDIAFPGDSIPGGAAQWEFDTDMGSIESALFAIVYRYCVREGEETNEMLGMGVVGAFVLVRTLSRIRVSSMCSAAPLDCGEPLGYFDWDMIQQGAFSGAESLVMFGVTAAAMEYCYSRRIISRFQ